MQKMITGSCLLPSKAVLQPLTPRAGEEILVAAHYIYLK